MWTYLEKGEGEKGSNLPLTYVCHRISGRSKEGDTHLLTPNYKLKSKEDLTPCPLPDDGVPENLKEPIITTYRSYG